MADVKIYDFVHGQKLERFIAKRTEAQGAVRSARDVLHRYISARHSAHDHPGGSYITKSQGRVDSYVNLEDSDGAAGAVWQEIFGHTDDPGFEREVFRPLVRRGRNYDWGKRFYKLKVRS